MKIRKFEAAEVSEALRAIREELGPDAVILSTREINQNAIGNPCSHKIEVTAAVEFDSPVSRGSRPDQSKFDQIFREMIPKIEKGEEILSIREELRSIKEAIHSLQMSPQLDHNQFYGRLYEICDEIKQAAFDHREKKNLISFHESLVSLYDRLLSSGVDHLTTINLIKLMNEKISPGDIGSEEIFKTYLEEVIKGMDQRISAIAAEKEDPYLMLLVGPSGAGKTTTLVKLAAIKALNHQNTVLATLDSSRIGAVDQLNAFGKIIGVPVIAASSVRELKGVMTRRKQGTFVFIDTPGQNFRNLHQFSQLKELKNIGIPMETHLVLSSHTREEDLDEMIDHFSALSIDRFIFTKTDETRRFGQLLSIMRRKRRSISYLTSGQRVPEDIEAATPKRIAELILTEEFKQGKGRYVNAGLLGCGGGAAWNGI